MPKQISISQKEASRFLLAHHYLWPPRRLRGKAGVMDYIQRVGCIQFDTINVVGRNADLVLQNRVKNYRPTILESLLYEERKLWDGWDKVQSIYRSTDWPHFEPRRQQMRDYYAEHLAEVGKLELAQMVRRAIEKRGPLSSLDIDHDDRLEGWSWGNETRAARASMEALYAMGELGVHRRINTRREFELVEKLLPGEVLAIDHPHATLEEYHDWHTLRRVGGLGLALNRGTDQWLGINHFKAPERYAALERLLEKELIVEISVKGLEGLPLFMRTEDLATLETASSQRAPKSQAAFIAPLDNLMWQRDLVEALFDFYYRWEVYVPAKKREFGYYVMPVLYGQRMVARMDPALDRKSNTLHIKNWWWENGVNEDSKAMTAAIKRAIKDFSKFLGAETIELGEEAKSPLLEAATDL